MTKNKHIQAETSSQWWIRRKLQYKKAVFQLHTLETLNKYKVGRERNSIVSLKKALEDKNFHEPVSADIHFPERWGYRYVFICNIKNFGIPIANNILFAQYYERSHSSSYFMWRESPDSYKHLN